MDNHVVSPEEQELEQEALAEVKAEQIRAVIITDFGFDEVEDAERIEKLVKKELDNREKLSKAIGQKRAWREKATKPAEPANPADSNASPADLSKQVDEQVKRTLEQRDLDALDYPDDIKAEIQRVATIGNKTIKQAQSDPYIVQRIKAHEDQKKAEEATVSRTNNSGASKSFDINNPPAFDPQDPEGSDKRYQEWRAEAKRRGH